jgi:hypothetical protein
MRSHVVCCSLVVLMVHSMAIHAADQNVRTLTDTIKRVDKHGAGHADAVAAAKRLQQTGADQLIEILSGMDDAGPLAANWLRGAFESVAERELKGGRQLPASALEGFIHDTKHGDRSRRLAYEWLVRIDKSAPDRLLPTMLDDPSLELRYDAVAKELGAVAAQEKENNSREKIVAEYRRILSHSRDVEQIKQITEKLKTLKEEVDMPTHFGFVLKWKLIGPFDSTGGKGFAAVYPPEKEVNFAKSYPGKTGPVGWQDYVTSDSYGMVDLNKAIEKHMGAVAYAAAEFTSDRDRPIDLRLGCINACKIWLNGELLLEREVYHTGMDIDQYVGKGKLKRGRNIILVKVCQNEQKEDWAQSWQFQLRVCDSRGTAVLSDETRRPGDKETRRAAVSSSN